jgi:flagellar hook assembly protein FlgD
LDGKLVKTLVSAMIEPGTHHFGWDGTMSNGSRVSAGVYVSRLSVGNKCMTKKVVLTR